MDASTVSRRELLIFCACIFALLFGVYGYSLGNEFVHWDDGLLIFENPIVQEFSFRSIYKAFTSYDPELYIPLTLLSYQMDHLIGGLNPFYYHLTNLILHALNAVSVAWIGWLLFKNKWIAALAAFLFAVHPLNTEAVVWASSRKDLLSAFFILPSFALYLNYSQNGSKRWYGASVIGFLLALLSKVTVIFFPLVLILADLRNHRRIDRRMILDKIPFFFLSIVFGIIAMFGKEGNATLLVEKILIGSKAAIFYLTKVFLPYGFSVLYPYTKPIAFSSPDLAISFVILLVLVIVSIALWKRTREPLFTLGFFLLFTAPTFANFAKGRDLLHDVYFASDRYAYIGSAAIFFLLASILYRYRSKVIDAVCIIVILMLAFLSYRQSLVWKNTETLFRNVLVHYPNSHVAHTNIGSILEQRGDTAGAIEEFEASLAIRPNAAAYYNLAQIASAKGDRVQAVDLYRKALTANPNDLEANINLGALLLESDPAEAIPLFQAAAKQKPNLSLIHFNLGIAYEKLSRREEAIAAFERTLEIDPSDAEAREHLSDLKNDQ